MSDLINIGKKYPTSKNITGFLEIYDNLPYLDERYTIDMDLISNPKLIKNQWNDSLSLYSYLGPSHFFSYFTL